MAGRISARARLRACRRQTRQRLVIFFLWHGPVIRDSQADARTRFPDCLLDVPSTGIPWDLVTCRHARQVTARLHVERQAFWPGHRARRRCGQRSGSLVAVRCSICRVVSARTRKRRFRSRWPGFRNRRGVRRLRLRRHGRRRWRTWAGRQGRVRLRRVQRGCCHGRALPGAAVRTRASDPRQPTLLNAGIKT
jgi:hypothetical protein